MIGRFLDEADTFRFACQTTGDCCRHYTIYCTPYDIVRLRHATETTTTRMLAAGQFEIVEESFAAVFTDDAVGAVLGLFGAAPKDLFPVARLRKSSDETGTHCPFLRPDNLCGVYAHRPAVCRSYPLGRVRTPDGPRWFERDYDCPGKGQGTQTVAGWVAESGLEEYATHNDVFAAFAEDVRAAGIEYARLDRERQDALCTLLYDFDRVLDVPGCDDAKTVRRIDAAARRWLADLTG